MQNTGDGTQKGDKSHTQNQNEGVVAWASRERATGSRKDAPN